MIYRILLQEVIDTLCTDDKFKYEETTRSVGEDGLMEISCMFTYDQVCFTSRWVVPDSEEGYEFMYRSLVKQLMVYGISKGVEVSKKSSHSLVV
jgi:hypothetical protein